MLPTKSLDLKSAPNKEGLKLSKDRITILFCLNKTGAHKMPPLVIGKSKNPRCFKSINRKHLPIEYVSSSKAWMIANLFLTWFHYTFVPSVQCHLKRKNLEPKALLFLDNCPAHPPADSLISKDGKIRAMYLPKNTTALIQRLDQGIIYSFKVNYRRELLLSLLSSNRDVPEFLKLITLKDVAYKISLAWESI
jgi:hypothetical protein